MTTEEKLNHFNSVILESTQAQCEKDFQEYKASMDKYFEEHKAEVIAKNQLEENIETDKIRRKASREYTTEQLHIRRKISHKQDELKNKIFAEVEALLEEFYTEPGYRTLLIKYIETAKRVARGEEIRIYLDAKDVNLKAELEKETGVRLVVDGRTFYGGIVAEIPSKNILIDNSFESKLDGKMETYLIEPAK